MKMDYNIANNVVDLQEIMKALPNTPRQVASQVYSEHGRLAKYQERYGAINIAELKWQLVQRTAAEICAASRQFEGHVESVAKRAKSFAKEGWKCIGHSEEAIAAWQTKKTWRTPPVFFSGSIAGSGESLRLVEGHLWIGVGRRHLLRFTSLDMAWGINAETVRARS